MNEYITRCEKYMISSIFTTLCFLLLVLFTNVIDLNKKIKKLERQLTMVEQFICPTEIKQ